jgi:hypothetical protein
LKPGETVKIDLELVDLVGRSQPVFQIIFLGVPQAKTK